MQKAVLNALCLGALVVLAGCSSLFGERKPDYRSGGAKTAPLEVPPDLSQLARESRYAASTGVVSALASQAAPVNSAAATSSTVAPVAADDIRVERDGQQRWLSVARPPEQLWPLIKSFWTDAGFSLEVESAQTGVLETGWREDRSKIPQDFIRSTIGRVFEGMYDSGRRDRYRTRLERTSTGTEIYVAHRGIEEVYTSATRDSTRWQSRPQDPQLEAEMLSRLMARLSQQSESEARERLTRSAATAVTAPAMPVGNDARLVMEDGFDRAWRRVGLALDRGGFSVEDRDRAAGLYFVRYIDPAESAKEEPGFFSRMLGIGKPPTLIRYRVQIKAEGNRSIVTLQDAEGKAQTGEGARLIMTQVANALR